MRLFLCADGVAPVGRMTGIHEQPETVARGRSGRMVVASVDITLVPHSPFAGTVQHLFVAACVEIEYFLVSYITISLLLWFV